MNTYALREFSFWMLHYRRTWRGTVVVSVANPLLFLLAMGAGLGNLVDHNSPAELAGTPYLAFFAPGLLAAAVMQTAYIESSRNILNSARPNGSYRSAIAGPLRPADVFEGHLLFIAFRIASSAAAFIAVLFLFDALSGPRLLWLLPAALLTGLAFATPIAAWAVSLDSPNPLNSLFRFGIMPLYMFSGTFFSVDQLPVVLRAVIEATPLWHGVELCRGLSEGTATPGATALHTGYLLVLTVAGFVLGRRAYQRRLHG